MASKATLEVIEQTPKHLEPSKLCLPQAALRANNLSNGLGAEEGSKEAAAI